MDILLPAIALLATSTATQEPPTRANGPYGPEVVNHLALEDAPEGRLRPLRTHRGESWADPTRVHFIGRGLVVLLDPTVSRVHRIRSDGSELESIGRAGEGPGEWPRLGQALLDDDELIVVARDRLFRYDGSGAEIASGSFQSPDVLLHAQGNRLVAQAINTDGWAVIETATDARRVIDPPTDRVPEAGYGGCWRRDADDSHLYRLSCAAGRLQVVDYEGATVRWIDLGDEPREATEAELDAYIERFWLLQSGGREMNPLVERQLTHIREEAAILPRWAALRVDRATGRLVLLAQPFGDAGDTEGVLHVVDPDGTHVLRIPTGRRIRDFAVHGDTLVTLARDPVTDESWLALDLLPPSGSR